MLQVIGAGLGRTGTVSLKLALERLLGAPCYHMIEVFENLDHIPLWRQAALGQQPDWQAIFASYKAAVDWPAASFWPELSAAFPEAMIILSVRETEAWWNSVRKTIFIDHDHAPETEWREMWLDIVKHRFTIQLDNKEACIEAFNRHYALVRETISPDRLLEWSVTDGWEPICTALNLPVPDEPFPHLNTTIDFQEKFE